MKIQGLVRAFNQVKGRLQEGIAPEEADNFRGSVRKLVGDVEEICRRNGRTPEDLPAPSRLAWRFLKDLDLDNLPFRQPGAGESARSDFRIRNVVKTGNYFVQKLWRYFPSLLVSARERNSVGQEILAQVRGIESICSRHNATPSALEGPSRQIYSWLKLLSNEDNLVRHLESLRLASVALGAAPTRFRTAVEVQLINMNPIWQARQYSNIFLLKANQGFMSAEIDVWQAIVRSAMSRNDLADKQIIQEYAVSEDFNEVLIEMDSYVASLSPSAGGHIHNLDESFDRVNAVYFGGRMPKPAIVWNRTPTLRKFGHYQPSRDTVMISITLDDSSVPAFVVDYVLYHELLHKKHGAMIVNGRRLAHSPAFRAEERLFSDYQRANDLINELARRHRGL